MNKTHAQLGITDQMWSRWSVQHAFSMGMPCLSLILIAAGLAGLTFSSNPRAAASSSAFKWAKYLIASLVVCLVLVDFHNYFAFEHDSFDGLFGGLYIKLLICLSAFGWAIGAFTLNPIGIAGVAAATASLTLREGIWDYYVLDIVVFSFFAFSARRQFSRQPSSFAFRHFFPTTLVALGLWHLVYVAQFKLRMDRGNALCQLGSRALGRHLLAPDEPSFLPFGLQGWYYFPYYVTHDANSGNIAAFDRYLKQNTVDVAWRFSKPLRLLPEHGGGWPTDRRGMFLSDRFSYFWIFTEDVMLLWSPPGHAQPAILRLGSNFVLPPFPKNDREWRQLINGKLTAGI
jgi:hypothetical protein